MLMARKSPRNRWVFLIFAILTGCGYHTTLSKEDPLTISIPLITNDEEGYLRNFLAKELTSSGGFIYTAHTCRYQLIVEILQDKIDAVGYSWDKTPLEGDREKRLYPSEERRVIQAKVRILDTDTDKDRVPPFLVTSRVQFDFVNPTVLENIEFVDLTGEKMTVLQFSQGQLDSQEGGRDASYKPLYKDLASRIVGKLFLQYK
jgi:hypothetical protein